MRSSTRTLALIGGGLLLLSTVVVVRSTVQPAADRAAAGGQGVGGGAAAGKLEVRTDEKQSHRLRGRRMDDPEVQRQAEEWYQELLARHPEFQVEFKDVPDDENGFLKFLDLAEFLSPDEPFEARLPLSDEMLGMLAGKTDFDGALLDDWIASNSGLFERLLDLAEAPDQSVKGQSMERYHFIAARVPHQAGQLLVASARSAMERGESEEALRLFRASVHLADHFDGVEIPSLLGKTVSVLVRLNAMSGFQEHILPQVIDHAGSAPVSELLGENGTVPLLPEPSLGPDAQKYLEIIAVGSGAWLRGFGREISVTAQHHALLAIALGEEPPVEPVTGEPFLWDPDRRTLSPPAGAPADIDPLKLPAAP